MGCAYRPDDLQREIPLSLTGFPGVWRFGPSQLDDEFEGRTALLSPLDRLVFDRKRMGSRTSRWLSLALG